MSSVVIKMKTNVFVEIRKIRFMESPILTINYTFKPPNTFQLVTLSAFRFFFIAGKHDDSKENQKSGYVLFEKHK